MSQSTRQRAPGAPSAPPPSAAGRDYRPFDMVSMGLVGSGLAAVEFISGQMIPKTMRHFFDSRLMISLIIDLNRVFGFVVQPYVATKGDTMQTRFGRRRPFFMIGFPLTVLFMLLIGASPMIVADVTLRHCVSILFVLFVLNVFMQAAQDISCGTEGPLYADLFPQRILGRAFSLRPVFSNSVHIFMMLVAMKWAVKNEFYPYLCSTAFVAFALAILVFAVREKPRPRSAQPKAEAYNVVKHARMLIDNTEYLKIAIVGSVGLAMPAAFGLFMVLFATEQLGLTLAEYGKAAWVGPAVGILLGIPAGQLVDRVGAKTMIALAFTLQLLAALAIIFYVRDFATLRLIIALNAAGGVLQGVAMPPLIFLNAPAAERGRVFGLIQFVRALAATIVSPLMGIIYDATKSYRNGYAICAALAVIGIIVVLMTSGRRVIDDASAVGGASDSLS